VTIRCATAAGPVANDDMSSVHDVIASPIAVTRTTRSGSAVVAPPIESVSVADVGGVSMLEERE
jgi:hypothetical protein